jgi:hypothetical protein
MHSLVYLVDKWLKIVELPFEGDGVRYILAFRLFLAVCVFLTIRYFWCWFWMTSAIAARVGELKDFLGGKGGVTDISKQLTECNLQLIKTNELLERIASQSPNGRQPVTDERPKEG